MMPCLKRIAKGISKKKSVSHEEKNCLQKEPRRWKTRKNTIFIGKKVVRDQAAERRN
jgi:hypothetical protein